MSVVYVCPYPPGLATPDTQRGESARRGISTRMAPYCSTGPGN